MSIINNVLKDLENKRPGFIPIDVAAANGPMQSMPRVNWFWPVLLVLIPLIAYLVWNNTERLEYPSPLNTASISAIDNAEIFPEQSQPITSTSITNNAEPAQAAANKIIGLQIKETDNIFNLEFVLQSQVVAYLKERDENSFVYHLKDIESEIIAPTLNNNQWIGSLNIIKAEDGVDIEFYTMDRVLIGTDQYRELDHSVWAITFENAKKASTQDVKVMADLKPKPIQPSVVLQTPAEKYSNHEVDSLPSVSLSPEIPSSGSLEEKPEVKLKISSTRQASSSLELQRATDLVIKRRWNQAETILLELLNLNEDREARGLLLQIYESSKQPGKLDNMLKESLLRYPEQPDFNMMQGRVYFSRGQFQSVIDLLIPAASAHANQLALIGASYQRLDEYQSAIEFYRASLKLEPRQARNWINLGLALEHNGELDKALEAYRAAIKLGNLSQSLSAFVDKRSRTLEKVVK